MTASQPSPTPPTIPSPLPLDWLERAAALPGKTLHVALALCWCVGQRQHLVVRLPRTALARFTVSRDASYDALRHLEQAGLITVFRHVGRSPEVTLLDGHPSRRRVRTPLVTPLIRPRRSGTAHTPGPENAL
ncbi:hypothetical protein [Thiocystis violacea]|uniref:hypothetical protein n=1 Tax=Thiocystis violacea TaxID=13725 RepID=UPI0019070C72|nr:hypothetical protein [Thiocystis violacea]